MGVHYYPYTELVCAVNICYYQIKLTRSKLNHHHPWFYLSPNINLVLKDKLRCKIRRKLKRFNLACEIGCYVICKLHCRLLLITNVLCSRSGWIRESMVGLFIYYGTSWSHRLVSWSPDEPVRSSWSRKQSTMDYLSHSWIIYSKFIYFIQ